jgi:hypothetical protein
MQESKSKFVISVNGQEKADVSSYYHYRCDRMFKRLTTWLQTHGVEDRNALHTLRKEFGTQINRSHGLFDASAATPNCVGRLRTADSGPVRKLKLLLSTPRAEA